MTGIKLDSILTPGVGKRMLVVLGGIILLHMFLSSLRMQDEGVPLDSLDTGTLDLHSSLAHGSEEALKEVGKADVDKFHIILMYPVLRISTLCTVESLVLSLLRGRSQQGKSQDLLRPAVVFVWLSHDDQQSDFFNYMLETIQQANVSRPVHLVRKQIAFEEEIKGTVLEGFYKGKKNSALGVYGEQNKGNALRLALVQKYGGMYMDADMLVLNDPSGLEDGVAMESYRKYNNAVFKFRKPGHPVVDLLLHNLVKNYDGDVWGQQGPLLFTRVLRKCKKNKSKQTLLCEESQISVWDKDHFYPYSWFQARLTGMSFEDFEKRYKLHFEDPKEEIMIHWWHKNAKWVETKLCKKGIDSYKKSFLGRLKSKYCPKVIDMIFKIPKGKGLGYCKF